MTRTNSTIDRRTALRSAAAAAGIAAAAGAVARPADAADAAKVVGKRLTRVRERLQLIDEQRRQRFLLSSIKPPVFVQGRSFPPEARSGPDDASYLIFNDENQSEKGGIIASSNLSQISLDYPTTQGLTINCVNEGQLGAAQISMNEAPDPTIPIEDLRPEDTPRRVVLGCSNAGDGSALFLFDSAGRPRIGLQVDADDIPRIQILGADGSVVAQLPPEASPQAKVKPPPSTPTPRLHGRSSP